jgi:hypothetical protein
MVSLLLIVAFPLCWPFIAKMIWGRSLNWQEMAINVAVAVALAGGTYWAGLAYQTMDREVWNGEVVSKTREEVSCSHSYSCNCKQVCSGSGKDRSCSTSCDTCYEHINDYDWVLKTNVKEDIDIDRVDRQGVHMPPRFAAAKAGDPVAVTKMFTNYVKAVPESLFNVDKGMQHEASFAGMLPEYPLSVYDYHYLNRAISVGVPVPDIQQWNIDIANTLKKLGPSKQANLIVLFVKSSDPNYVYALQKHWLGGKKNDVVVMLGSTEYPKLDWVRVMSWTDEEIFKVTLRDSLQDLEFINRERMIPIISDTTVKLFKRKHMRDFEYLKTEIEPPTWVMALAVALGVISSLLLSMHFAGKLDGLFRRKRFTPRNYYR